MVSVYSQANTTATATLAPADVVVHTYSLNAGSTPVAARVLAVSGVTSDGPTLTADSNLSGAGFVVLVPTAPLVPNTTYTATFMATVKGVAVSKVWAFTTGAAN